MGGLNAVSAGSHKGSGKLGMNDLRKTVDRLEQLVDDSRWPLPKYREMLFIY